MVPMSKLPPPDDELWTSAGPLQPPDAAAAARAKPIFERWLNEVRGNPSRLLSGATPIALGVLSWRVGGGRRYDLALTVALGPQQARLLMEQATSVPPPRASAVAPPRASAPPMARAPTRSDKLGLLPMEDDPTTISEDSTLEPTVIHTLPDPPTREANRPAPTRPPAGAVTVRAPLKTGQKPAEVDQEAWQQTADTALLRTQPDGGMAFDVVIRDDVFADLSCTIAVHEGHATATFWVSDANTRRLLEAEAGRLRSALEGRGLRVERIEVIVNKEP